MITFSTIQKQFSVKLAQNSKDLPFYYLHCSNSVLLSCAVRPRSTPWPADYFRMSVFAGGAIAVVGCGFAVLVGRIYSAGIFVPNRLCSASGCRRCCWISFAGFGRQSCPDPDYYCLPFPSQRAACTCDSSWQWLNWCCHPMPSSTGFENWECLCFWDIIQIAKAMPAGFAVQRPRNSDATPPGSASCAYFQIAIWSHWSNLSISAASWRASSESDSSNGWSCPAYYSA